MGRALVHGVLADEALTRGLNDPEARILVEWLVDQVEQLHESGADGPEALAAVRRLCRSGRAISRFIHLWCHAGCRPAALQLAATERFAWPLPDREMDPCELMVSILSAEPPHHRAAA